MADLRNYAKQQGQQGKPNQPQKKQLSKEERRALVLIKKEAREHKAELHSDGEGGLAPSLVLYVFRRDGFRCKVCGSDGKGKVDGLQVHHVAGIENPSKRLKPKGHLNMPDNIVTICTRCHNSEHSADRELTEAKENGEAPKDAALGDADL